MQFATQDQQNATQVQKYIAIFTIKYPITTYILRPNSSNLQLFAIQNFESKLLPVYKFLSMLYNTVLMGLWA